MKAPRIMLAAGRSGSGKTMITCGLLRALQQMGKQPAAFKCGPDYIDPMFHEQVIGAPSCNLDPFFTEEETTQYLFCKHAAGHDISVLEGVMGYYDGLGGISTKGSAYDLAGMTKTPVLLVVDAKGMSVSALAFIKGYLQYKEDSRIAGVIFNRMSEMLYREIAPMAEKELGISCVGFVPELKECHLESRHLGLVMPDEVENLQEQVNLLAETLQKTLDFEKILAIAEGAEELSGKMPEVLRKVTESEAAAKVRAAKPILAVAKDEAFCFFYRDNLELLASLGAKIEYFSPLSDAEPPKNTDGFLFCGGYPELHAEELSENQTMRTKIRDNIRQGMPVLAECGGYMYLSESMEDMDGNVYPMVQAVPGNVYRTLSAAGGFIRMYPLQKEKGFLLQDDFCDDLTDDLDLVFLCNPNNPTGLTIPQELLLKILDNCRERNIYLVLDECFIEFLPEPEKVTMQGKLDEYPNLLILRAFTKIYAMPGLRLGYLLCSDEDLLDRISRSMQSWNVSIPAQMAGLAALNEDAYVKEARELIGKERAWMKAELEKAGLTVWDSCANYLFFEGPKGLAARLEKGGILIRDCSNYPGLADGYYRAAVRTHEENQILTEAVSQILQWF